MDGTRTYLVGRRLVAIVDPGPDLAEHVRAVADAASGASDVTILLTHRHEDHAGATDRLVRVLSRGVTVRVVGAGHVPVEASAGDFGIQTDAGLLRAIPTPGHTEDHLAFHWPREGALFAGDLLLGEGDTTWVAGYPGCVADYLSSLARVRRLALDVIYPTHGPVISEPNATIDRFDRHRRERIEQVRRVLSEEPGATAERLAEVVYGDAIPEGLEHAAVESVRALADHLRGGPGRTS